MAQGSKVNGEAYEFGPFRLSVAERVLWRDKKIVPLTPKCFDTLLLLARHAGAVVEKEALMRAVWPDSFVEESNLSQNIFVLRKTLGELPEGGSYIQTVPKRGYRLVALPMASPQQTIPVATTAARPMASRSSYFLAIGIIMACALLAARSVWLPTEKSPADPRFTPLAVPNNVAYAVIAPNGKHFAYVSRDAEGQSLWVRETAALGAGTRLVASSEGHFWGISYSPDAQYVYYVFEDERDPAEASLFLIPAAGGEGRKLLNGVSASPAFSPDGTVMVYKRYDPNGHAYLLTATALGAGIKVLVESDAPHAFQNYCWAADGKSIYYVEGAKAPGSGQWSAWEVPRAGGRAREVMALQPKLLSSVNWLSRTEILTLMPERDSGKSQIWRFTSRGLLRRLTNDINDYAQFNVTADGRTLLVNSRQTDDTIWVISLGGQPQRMMLPPESYGYPVWMPDGRVVFTSQSNLWLSSADGRNRKPLLAQKSLVYEPAITPDGRNVIFTLRSSGLQNLWCVGIDGTNLRQITSGPFDWHPAISRDGKWVVYEAWSSPMHAVWKAPLDGSGPPVKLADTGVTYVTFSPDSRQFAYRSDTGRLEIRNLEDGALVRELPVPQDLHSIEWSTDGKSLTYYCETANGMQFFRQILPGGLPVRLDQSLPRDVSAVNWSADQRRIVYLRREIRIDLALLTNLP